MGNKVRPLPCTGSDLSDRRNSGGSIWRQNTLQLLTKIATGSQKNIPRFKARHFHRLLFISVLRKYHIYILQSMSLVWFYACQRLGPYRADCPFCLLCCVGRMMVLDDAMCIIITHCRPPSTICLNNRARFLSLARSKLRLCSANHRPGYWSNLSCDWPSTAWDYSEQEPENEPWWPVLTQLIIHVSNQTYFPITSDDFTDTFTCCKAAGCCNQAHKVNVSIHMLC